MGKGKQQEEERGKKTTHKTRLKEEERFTKMYPVLGRRRLGGNSNIGREWHWLTLVSWMWSPKCRGTLCTKNL